MSEIRHPWTSDEVRNVGIAWCAIGWVLGFMVGAAFMYLAVAP